MGRAMERWKIRVKADIETEPNGVASRGHLCCLFQVSQ